MNYATFRKLVLRHIDQYTIAGSVIPDTYNNQADDTSKIPDLTNVVLREIATTTRPLMATLDPNAPDFEGRQEMGNGWTKITMPADFWQVTGRGMPKFNADGQFERTMEYYYVTNNELMFRTSDLVNTMLTYYRYPRVCHGNPDEILDCSDPAADAASYYVAAELVRDDNAFAYSVLHNQFEDLNAKLQRPMTAEMIPVRDAYFGNWACPYC